MDKRQQAKEMIRHYFGMLFKRTGSPMNDEMASEIESIVDLIIEAAKEESSGNA